MHEASDEGGEGENECRCASKGVDDFTMGHKLRERLRRAWGGKESKRGASGDERKEKEKSGRSPDNMGTNTITRVHTST